MDIKELNKTQLILLTLLITFVVSIATGIITVSIMQQMPKSVPQTINNVIQRTIEKVTTAPTVTTPTPTTQTGNKDEFSSLGDGDAVVSIYPSDGTKQPAETTPSTSPGTVTTQTGSTTPPASDTTPTKTTEAPKALGEGIIISDIGLILVDSDILNDAKVYKVTLNQIDFDATILKKFSGGFTILKLTPKKQTEGQTNTIKTPAAAASAPSTEVDKKP